MTPSACMLASLKCKCDKHRSTVLARRAVINVPAPAAASLLEDLLRDHHTPSHRALSSVFCEDFIDDKINHHVMKSTSHPWSNRKN